MPLSLLKQQPPVNRIYLTKYDLIENHYRNSFISISVMKFFSNIIAIKKFGAEPKKKPNLLMAGIQ
jgi:hypothetical protein